MLVGMGSASRLQAEIKQARPFKSRRSEAALGLLRTADLIRRNTAQALASSKLSPEQYNVLRILRGAGSDGLPTLDVAERMIEQSPAITRLLDKLEAKRLVRRVRCKEDRRRVLCFITPGGIDLLTDLDKPVEDATRSALSTLDSEELNTLISLMDRIRSA